MSIERITFNGVRSQKTLVTSIQSKMINIRKERIRESLFDFDNEEHRLEYITTVRGVDFINDSKATNINATWFGLESMNRPVIWIVGSLENNAGLSQLTDIAMGKVKSIICLSKNGPAVEQLFANTVDDISSSSSMVEVVAKAYYKAQKGDVVLFSPACASFDMYDNYEARGIAFKRAVAEL